MTPKERFQKNSEAYKNLNEVIASEWFAESLVYATAELLDGKITAEQLEGAKLFRAALLGLCEGKEVDAEFPTSGLKHRIEIKRPEPPPQPKAK